MTLFTDTLFITDEIAGFRQCRKSRSEVSMTILLCKAGAIDVVLNRKTIHIGPNDIFVRIPTYGAELGPYDYTEDFEFKQVTIHSSVFEELMLDHLRVEPRWWQKQEYLRENPVFHLDSKTIDFCETYFHLLEVQLDSPRSEYRLQILKTLARAATMEILDFLDKVLQPVSERESRASTNQSDYTFHEFMRLLQQNPHRREVQWFASRLAISPKYLSEICKARSGKSASEWIVDVTVSELKHRLRHSTLSIHEVAQEMEFPNASFFCQYTKKHTGMTPNHFRKQKEA